MTKFAQFVIMKSPAHQIPPQNWGEKPKNPLSATRQRDIKGCTIEMPLSDWCDRNPTVKTALPAHLKLATVLENVFSKNKQIIFSHLSSF